MLRLRLQYVEGYDAKNDVRQQLKKNQRWCEWAKHIIKEKCEHENLLLCMLGSGLDINLVAAIEGEGLDELAIAKIREEDHKQSSGGTRDSRYESAITGGGTNDCARQTVDDDAIELLDKK